MQVVALAKFSDPKLIKKNILQGLSYDKNIHELHVFRKAVNFFDIYYERRSFLYPFAGAFYCVHVINSSVIQVFIFHQPVHHELRIPIHITRRIAQDDEKYFFLGNSHIVGQESSLASGMANRF